MKKLLCPQLPKPHRPAHLPESEANHAVRVLRLRDGDSVLAMDGQGGSTPAILRLQGGPPRLELPAGAVGAPVGRPAVETVTPLTLEMAVLKGDAMEWVVEKAVELGVARLVPLLTAHTVVQIKNKGPEAFRERWQKIADQALKQCGRLERLEIDIPTPLDQNLLRHPSRPEAPRLWCDEAAGQAVPSLAERLSRETPPALRLLIGPEGGWSTEERALLAPSSEKITLGPLVLRAETAAIYGISLGVTSLRGAKLLTKTHG